MGNTSDVSGCTESKSCGPVSNAPGSMLSASSQDRTARHSRLPGHRRCGLSVSAPPSDTQMEPTRYSLTEELPDLRPIFEAYADDLKREAERIAHERRGESTICDDGRVEPMAQGNT